MTDPVFPLSTFPVHLDRAAGVIPLERFDGTPEWYARYSTTYIADGTAGRLVTLHTFSESWDSWEMHPLGEELVVCVTGSVVLHQEIDGATTTVMLNAGDAVVNPAGAWHTADVTEPCTALFITAGTGTEIPRPLTHLFSYASCTLRRAHSAPKTGRESEWEAANNGRIAARPWPERPVNEVNKSGNDAAYFRPLTDPGRSHDRLELRHLLGSHRRRATGAARARAG